MIDETEESESAMKAQVEEHCSQGVQMIALDEEAASLSPVALAGPPREGDKLVQNDVTVIAEHLAAKGLRVCLYYGDLRFRHYHWWRVQGE